MGKGRSAERGIDGRLAALASCKATSSRPPLSARSRSGGWTLLELVVTMTVLSILTVGVVPLIKTSVKRQREHQLRETLRGMREAIKEFRRDAVGLNCGAQAGGNQPPLIDPRSKVMISDCRIFGIENPDHYPPKLETLVEGVSIVPRGGIPAGGSSPSNPTNPTQNSSLVSTKKKVYLRAIPVDPVTGQAEWELRSSYDAADATSWGGENVFDVRSKSSAAALDGTKYSDW